MMMVYPISNDTMETYRSFWKSQSLFWRLWQRCQWRLGNLMAALFGGLTPGEKLLLRIYKEDKEELNKCHQILDKAAEKYEFNWQNLTGEIGDDDPTIPLVRYKIPPSGVWD